MSDMTPEDDGEDVRLDLHVIAADQIEMRTVALGQGPVPDMYLSMSMEDDRPVFQMTVGGGRDEFDTNAKYLDQVAELLEAFSSLVSTAADQQRGQEG